MVKEISEYLVSPIADIDISALEDRLFDRISERKEECYRSEIEGCEVALPYISYPSSARSLCGGGTAPTDKEHKETSALKKLQLSNEVFQAAFNDQQRRKSILTLTSTGLSSHHELKQPSNAEIKKDGGPVDMNALKLIGINQAALEKRRGELDINIFSQTNVLVSDIESTKTVISSLEQELKQPDKSSSHAAEVRHIDLIPVDIATSLRGEPSSREENAQVLRDALQKHLPEKAPSDSGVKVDTASRSMDLKYPFKSWSGEHSVKVSVPAEARRDGTLILHPSDSRAADALSRQAADLVGYTPDIVQPWHSREEPEQHTGSHEEEQE
ncbi:hypothetical protein [Erwinia piriflorinigrans]|uniref:Type III secretion system protein n=1 Tax=Erwinia piriflorinigrans CFBP 5888 TaxID=1161919 RepID=V5Z5D5_9GAMM|nr:hypothetical protein [Erwinia piriflorinigrans]CCG86230.1 type III secretion system protein [Erwinia piriflorinigrans CFBP 5888]